MALQAANVAVIAQYHYPAAFASGMAISWLWTANVKSVAFSDGWDRVAYALGGAVGTVVGMGVGHWLGGGAL